MVQLGGIIGVDDAICDDAYPGSRYLQVAAYTGGLIGDICKSDWSTMLADLGLTATGIRTSFQTTQLAKPDTLVVQMGPNDNNMEEVPEDPVNGWTYDEDTWYLSFGPNAIPERDWQITADYTVQPGASAPSAGTAE